MTEIPYDPNLHCEVCACSPAWDFGTGPRCTEHYGEAADPKMVGLLKGPSGVLNIGSGEVQGSRDNPSRKARNHPERDFQGRVIDLLHLHGFKVAHFRPAMDSKGRWHTAVQADGAGWPDIVAIKSYGKKPHIRKWGDLKDWYCGADGIAWELKAKGEKATPEQQDWLRLFELAGFHARAWHEDEEDNLIKLVEEWE